MYESVVGKPWYQSKTLAIGALEFIIGAGLLVSDFLSAAQFTPAGFVLLGVGIATVILRLVTSQPIG